MKRRAVLQTAASALMGMLSMQAFSRKKLKNKALDLQVVDATTLSQGDIHILRPVMPENIYAMPPQFWQKFEGKLWVGKAKTDARKTDNQIPVFLRDAYGTLSQINQPISLNKRNFNKFIYEHMLLIANPSHSIMLEDNNSQTVFNIPDINHPGQASFNQRLAQPAGYQLIGEILSVDDLRKTRPLFEGAKIKLKSWHFGLEVGGGEFVGSFKNMKEDQGVIFSGNDFCWRRVVNDFNSLSLFDFGAIADGKTDNSEAIKAMYQWSQQNEQSLCVKFPAGTFFVSSCNFGDKQRRFFRISGAMVNFGYFPTTTIVSDGKSAFIFQVSARWVEISGLIFNGNIDKHPNKQGLFCNTCPGGQFFRGTCLGFKQVGGTAISVLDTLDCKIDQWYASACAGDVIQASWSGQKKGNWDHSTAIELSNFNAQYCKFGKVLNLPRCSQSLIHNGWIEHCDNPGDISNGQWIIDALSLEDCKTPLIAWNSRLNMRQTNLQSGSLIDNSTVEDERWLSIWEMGSTRVESYGVAIDGSLKYNYLTSCWRLENNTSQDNWFELGSIYSPALGDMWEFEIFGQAQFKNGSSQKPLMNLISDQTTGGRAIIQVQRKRNYAEASWSAEGSSPVVEVRCITLAETEARIFIKMACFTPVAMVLIKSTGRDRFITGRCAHFNAKMTFTSPPIENDSCTVPQRLSIHNGKAGVGANEFGDLLVSSRELSSDKVDTKNPGGFISVVINGKRVALPYFSIKV